MSENRPLRLLQSEISEDELESEPADASIEAKYRASKDSTADDPAKALEGFQEVIRMELESSDTSEGWGLKALRRITKLHFRLGNSREVATACRDMLSHLGHVTIPQGEKSLTKLMEFVNSSNEFTDKDLIQVCL
eukprot:jgi/Botrbrau1/10215/Bobra.0362s0005.1